ncbi:hypothetical protein [Nonomuraea sp. NPDC049129]|uniref:hypothetical protein n=1 Tax=Nonomuraea sp. NPDC049129 TaxID=3155272 RepID=UPI0033CA08C8
MLIEANKRTISYYDENGEWMDGDSRLIEEECVPDFTLVDDDRGMIDAIQHLRRMESFESSIHPVSTHVREWDWLTGRYEHPYENTELETTVRIHDTDDITRGIIFAAVTA